MIRRAVISYIPALHQGYINFLKQNPGDVYVLGRELVHEVPRMERDIRAISPLQMRKTIESLGLAGKVGVLNKKNVVTIKKSYQRLILPDEDVNRHFAEKYLKAASYKLVPAFLRWDRHSSTVERDPPADRKISRKRIDKILVGQAFDEASKSPDWWRQVGAVVIKNGKPVLVAHNRPFPSEDYTINIFGDPRSNFDYGEFIELSRVLHAEAGIVSGAANAGISLAGATLYVTTFPCPGCAKLVAAAGIKKIYYSQGYSLLDAEDVFNAAGIEIILVKNT